MAYDPWAYTSPCGVLNGGVLISEVGLLATLRLRGTSGRDGCQVQKKKKKVHCGTVLVDAFSTWRQICPQK